MTSLLSILDVTNTFSQSMNFVYVALIVQKFLIFIHQYFSLDVFRKSFSIFIKIFSHFLKQAFLTYLSYLGLYSSSFWSGLWCHFGHILCSSIFLNLFSIPILFHLFFLSRILLYYYFVIYVNI